MPRIYALLAGITDYPGNPLFQSVDDAIRMKEYLASLHTSSGKPKIRLLVNEEATRDGIINAFREHLYKAKDDDVVLFYFSGHGALEKTTDIFPDEHDGSMDCLVCYSGKKTSTKQLLSGKEVRYLFHKMPHNPHVATVIDACHSGDVVRSVKGEGNGGPMIKRLSGFFKERPYRDFLFAGDPEVERNENGKKRVYIPFKNSVHLAACLSSESAMENLNGGVFTTFLLALLENTKGNVTYMDISRWAKMSLVDVTSSKQTPRVSVQGEGKTNQYSPWLNIAREGVRIPPGMIVNNGPNGWFFSRGTLLGMRPGMKVRLHLNDQESELLEVEAVEIERSKLKIPLDLINRLDFNRHYEGESEETTYRNLDVFVHAIDDDTANYPEVEEIIQETENVVSATDVKASFYLNFFNGYAYFTLPETPFRPLARQLKLGSPEFSGGLEHQLKALVKWNHFLTLENPGDTFEKCPIRVEIKVNGQDWADITNGVVRMQPRDERHDSLGLLQTYKMRISNLTKETLFVGVLALNSDISITSNPFAQRVVELKPDGEQGATREFYDHKENALAYTALDDYKEVYNWKEEWLYYKFIFNNFEDFTQSIANREFLQAPLEPPYMELGLRTTGRQKGEGALEDLKEVKKKWGTCITRIELANSSYDQPTGQLLSNFNAYRESDIVRPFLEKVYSTPIFQD